MSSPQQLDAAIRVATVVAPVAMYFLVLGLLNSRRRPQILSGRLDFALLIAALSPLLVVPALHVLGVSATSVGLAVTAVVCGISLLAPRGGTWVIYNIAPAQTKRAIRLALRDMGQTWRMDGDAFELDGGQGCVRVSSFPMLRNVSVRFSGSQELSGRLGRELSYVLSGMSAETEPAAVALLLVATVMMLVPLAFVANHAGEIVRILTDLLN